MCYQFRLRVSPFKAAIFTYIYTITLQSCSIVSAKFEAAVRFYKDTLPHQRRQVDEKGCLDLQINFKVSVFDDRSGFVAANIDDR